MDKEDVVHIYNEILLAIENNAFESVLMRWMDLEPVVQSKVTQKEEKQISYINIHKWNLEKWY